MSRSTRRPWITDQQTNSPGPRSRPSLAKRAANRAVRAANKRACAEDATTVADGKAYRKESCSWAIRDYSLYSPTFKKAWRK